MDNLKPIKTRYATNQKIFVHKNLMSCSHVFVRIDRVKKPLEPPYTGPFQVLDRNEKYFSVLIKDKTVNISIDRLKPAYMLTTDIDDVPEKVIVDNETNKHSGEKFPQATSDSENRTTITRSGRQVKLPVRFRD